MSKVFTIIKHNSSNGNTYTQSGTLQELIEAYSYTLETGKCYEHEKGNKKINLNPKSAKALVTQLNNAVNNSAANGCSNYYFTLE